jgi:enoyl-CoA hydratase/carnithine racemase
MGGQERLSAQRAYELGIVTEVIPHERLVTHSEELAKKINLNAPLALEGTVKSMWRSLN